MSIDIDFGMVNRISGDESYYGQTITVAAGVRPFYVELNQSVVGLLELFRYIPHGWGAFPEVDQLVQIIGLWDDLIARSIAFVPDSLNTDIRVNHVADLPSYSGGLTAKTFDIPFIANLADVYLTPDVITAGEYSWTAAVHEFGHALGLSHPGEYNADRSTITYEDSRSFDADTSRYSIMSYFAPDADGSAANWDIGEIVTPMIYDILAIQKLYGTDTTTRTGDTVYGFNSNADRAVFHFVVGPIKPVLTIWDAGGRDRLDVSGYGNAARIDLTSG